MNVPKSDSTFPGYHQKLVRLHSALLKGVTISSGAFLFPASSLHGTEWFISPGGNDANPGIGEAAPFQTLAKADSLLVTGDTIVVQDCQVSDCSGACIGGSSDHVQTRTLLKKFDSRV